MSEIPKISEAEWEVMKIFWAKAVPLRSLSVFWKKGSGENGLCI
ncbi:MAG: hypothetical protein ACYDEJ_15180 [Desulfitobacteriaceae bacterium]